MLNNTPNHLKNKGKLSRKLEAAVPSTSDFSAFLRNQHPSDTVYWVASLGGFKESTVEAWIYEKALPQARHLGPLLAIYGPAVLAAIFPRGFSWLDDAVRAERMRALEARRAAIDEEMRQLANDDTGDGS
jgi:hypothetical protein